MPTLTCECEDFKLGMPQIIAAQIGASVAPSWGIKYTGKPFKFCPWCGKVLDPPKIENKEELAWQDYILRGK